MKMPEQTEDGILAVCGVNCALCYRYVNERRRDKPCVKCLAGDEGRQSIAAAVR